MAESFLESDKYRYRTHLTQESCTYFGVAPRTNPPHGGLVRYDALMRLRWLSAAFITAIVMALLNQYAISHTLYWRYAWVDTPIHFLGGLCIALVVIALFDRMRPLLLVAVVAVIALGWEVFEAVVGVPRENQNYFFDTSVDIFMDALGALTAYVIARASRWRL